ncbi:MAG: hypothetical protein AVDCRST_MAG38-1197, partial [uncultured Solirubrobacteraceae bacterium]
EGHRRRAAQRLGGRRHRGARGVVAGRNGLRQLRHRLRAQLGPRPRSRPPAGLLGARGPHAAPAGQPGRPGPVAAGGRGRAGLGRDRLRRPRRAVRPDLRGRDVGVRDRCRDRGGGDHRHPRAGAVLRSAGLRRHPLCRLPAVGAAGGAQAPRGRIRGPRAAHIGRPPAPGGVALRRRLRRLPGGHRDARRPVHRRPRRAGLRRSAALAARRSADRGERPALADGDARERRGAATPDRTRRAAGHRAVATRRDPARTGAGGRAAGRLPRPRLQAAPSPAARRGGHPRAVRLRRPGTRRPADPRALPARSGHRPRRLRRRGSARLDEAADGSSLAPALAVVRGRPRRRVRRLPAGPRAPAGAASREPRPPEGDTPGPSRRRGRDDRRVPAGGSPQPPARPAPRPVARPPAERVRVRPARSARPRAVPGSGQRRGAAVVHARPERPRPPHRGGPARLLRACGQLLLAPARAVHAAALGIAPVRRCCERRRPPASRSVIRSRERNHGAKREPRSLARRSASAMAAGSSAM